MSIHQNLFNPDFSQDPNFERGSGRSAAFVRLLSPANPDQKAELENQCFFLFKDFDPSFEARDHILEVMENLEK